MEVGAVGVKRGLWVVTCVFKLGIYLFIYFAS